MIFEAQSQEFEILKNNKLFLFCINLSLPIQKDTDPVPKHTMTAEKKMLS